MAGVSWQGRSDRPWICHQLNEGQQKTYRLTLRVEVRVLAALGLAGASECTCDNKTYTGVSQPTEVQSFVVE